MLQAFDSRNAATRRVKHYSPNHEQLLCSCSMPNGSTPVILWCFLPLFSCDVACPDSFEQERPLSVKLHVSPGTVTDAIVAVEMNDGGKTELVVKSKG